MISCRTLGELEVLVDGVPAPRELRWKKHLALLLYLAHSPRGTRAKQHLISLFWLDVSKPNQSLSQAQSSLRKRGGVGVGETSGQVRLDLATVELDTTRFEALVAKQQWADAAALVAGPFLDGFTCRDTPEFEDWIGTQRERWRGKCVDVLVRYAEQLMHGGATEQALPVAEQAMELAPHSNPVECVRITALWLLGRRDEALETHERFKERLKADLGTAPDPETETLIRNIRDRRVPRADRSKRPAPKRRAPLVGRGGELIRICDCCARCRESGEAILGLVLGDPGSGKTRFVEEVTARALFDGFATAVVHVVQADLAQAGEGLVALAEGGLLDAPGVPSAPALALAALSARSSLWAERFHQPNSGDLYAMPRAFAEIVRAATEEKPVLLVVDDAHWMDTESLLALTAVLRDLARRPVMVLLAATADPLRVELEEIRSHMGRDQKGASVTLGLFGPAELAALSRWALPKYNDEQVDRLVRRVQADSGGLPLIAVELISAVASGLEPRRTGSGVWPASQRTLYDTFPGDLPDAVVGAVRVNYSRLTADAQLALVAVAVIGERVSRKQVERATGMSAERLDRALDELEWQRWLVAETRGYAFLARIIRELVLPMKTKGERARLRERAGLEPE